MGATEGSFEGGQATLDNEHLVQVGLADAVLDAAQGAHTGGELAEVLTRFIDYSELHFLSEQLLMRLHAYPDHDEHVADHEALIERMRALRDALDDDVARAGDRVRRLKGELLGHIRNRDAALHAFLARRDTGRA